MDQRISANIGIKAGTDALHLDIDNKDGKNGSGDLLEIEVRLGDLPVCPKAITPTGGEHLYFKHPGIDVIGQAGVKWKGRKTGIDIRIGNQYVVAPPSILSNTDTGYQWETPLVPINDLPDLPQYWIDQFLPRRNEAVAKMKPPKSPEVEVTEAPGAVLPMTINGEAEKQFVKYLETCPKSIQGRCGHSTLCSVARAGVRGFKLEPQRAADIAWEYYNLLCIPFWTESETNIAKKICGKQMETCKNMDKEMLPPTIFKSTRARTASCITRQEETTSPPSLYAMDYTVLPTNPFQSSLYRFRY